jgi:hypothetical protein
MNLTRVNAFESVMSVGSGIGLTSVVCQRFFQGSNRSNGAFKTGASSGSSNPKPWSNNGFRARDNDAAPNAKYKDVRPFREVC